MKLEMYNTQTQNFCAVDLRTTKHNHDFLAAASKGLTEKINEIITISKPIPINKIEVQWYCILDKTQNPRGELGFWDIQAFRGEDDGTRNPLMTLGLNSWRQINK